MNIIRLLILTLVIWLIFRLVRHMLAKPSQTTSTRPQAGTNMVRCAHCGIHIPENEALYRDEHPFCCEAHREAGPK